MTHRSSDHAKTLLEQIVDVAAISPDLNIEKHGPEKPLSNV
jgi:hypothetical protein